MIIIKVKMKINKCFSIRLDVRITYQYNLLLVIKLFFSRELIKL